MFYRKGVLSLVLALVLSFPLLVPCASASNSHLHPVTVSNGEISITIDKVISQETIRCPSGLGNGHVDTLHVYHVAPNATLSWIADGTGSASYSTTDLSLQNLKSTGLQSKSEHEEIIKNDRNATLELPSDLTVVIHSFRLSSSGANKYSAQIDYIVDNGKTELVSFLSSSFLEYANSVAVSSWAKEQIVSAFSLDLIPVSLMGDNYQVNISRAKFAALSVGLFEAMGGKVPSSKIANPFNDTTDPYVLSAYQLGFVNGVGGNAFAPNEPVTREQAATILARVYEKLGHHIPSVSSTSFADNAKISGYAKSSVAFLSAKGIINGIGNNLFGPQGFTSIEQAILIALRMFQTLK